MLINNNFNYIIKISIFCFLSLLLYSNVVIAQEKELIKLSDYEDTLKILANIVLYSKQDFIKYEANEKLLTLFEEALTKPKAYEYNFDSLKTISKLASPDNTFKLYTWILPKEDGTYEYFGFIHAKHKKQYNIYKLIDNSENIESPENKTLDANNWYGALYYKIIYNKYKRKKTYTLLGWDGNNRISNKKIIDVLTFNLSNKPIFGYPMFKGYYKKNIKRIIFEYNVNAYMTLRYEKQNIGNVIKTNKKRKESNRKVLKNELKNEKANMIVFNRLSPFDPRTGEEKPSLEGQFQYYVPEANIIDAFIFKKGKWLFIKDIDAKNPKTKRIRKLKVNN